MNSDAPRPVNAASRPCVAELHSVERVLGSGEEQVRALAGVSLAVAPGELLAVTGPSGCGKSTLLLQLGLLDRPDQGRVVLGGRDLTHADDATRARARLERIGFVFQFHQLLRDFSVLENVLLPLARAGVPRDEARSRAHELVARVGLRDKAGRVAAHLSGGEQQRVALARALANRPALLLADEPTGNLDAANSERVFELLLELASVGGQSVVVATHNPDLARRCHRVVRMLDGKITSG